MRIIFGFVFPALILLGACSSIGETLDTRQNAGPCPTVGALYETSRIIEFSSEVESYDNIAYTGEINGVRLYCRYAAEDPLLAEIEIDFAFGKGPQAANETRTYTYFVAVTRRDRTVLNRQTFTIDANFKGQRVIRLQDVIGDIVIPRKDTTISGANFEILVGFELTSKQLQFNREGKRFRLDAG